MNPPTPILDLRAITCRFGGLVAVSDVSLGVKAGTITSLVGPNGAGKTTLFNIISGFVAPTSGEIYFQEQSVTTLKPHQRAQRGLGRTFQDPRIFQDMTVLDHVLTGFSLPDENPALAIVRGTGVKRARRAAIERARELLNHFGLSSKAADTAGDLSFGEQRFLSIARTLASDPKLILFDEPSVGLDGSVIDRLKSMIRDLTHNLGKTVLIVEHNLDVVFEISDKIHLMVGGKLVLSGTAAELQRHPTMIEAYLGETNAPLCT